MPASTPDSAASRLASSNTMFADLPPSSSVTGVKRWAAAWPTARPASTPPVSEILSTSGCSTSALPVSPSPVMTLKTPGGKPTPAASSATASIDADVTSDGLTTTVLPAASAGAAAIMVRNTGEFHGVMIATTPSGSGTV